MSKIQLTMLDAKERAELFSIGDLERTVAMLADSYDEDITALTCCVNPTWLTGPFGEGRDDFLLYRNGVSEWLVVYGKTEPGDWRWGTQGLGHRAATYLRFKGGDETKAYVIAGGFIIIVCEASGAQPVGYVAPLPGSSGHDLLDLHGKLVPALERDFPGVFADFAKP